MLLLTITAQIEIYSLTVMFNKNMEIIEKDYNKLNSIQDDIKVNVNSMTNIRKGDNSSPVLGGENVKKQPQVCIRYR
jgi:hypothetical protein